MKRMYILFTCLVIFAPILFFFYWKNDLVCAPRAIVSEIIFGVPPLLLLSIAYLKRKKAFYYLSLVVPVIVIFITPIIMLNRLGWEKFYNERLLAFFTFEGFAIAQIIIISLMLKDFLNLKNG